MKSLHKQGTMFIIKHYNKLLEFALKYHFNIFIG